MLMTVLGLALLIGVYYSYYMNIVFEIKKRLAFGYSEACNAFFTAEELIGKIMF